MKISDNQACSFEREVKAVEIVDNIIEVTDLDGFVFKFQVNEILKIHVDKIESSTHGVKPFRSEDLDRQPDQKTKNTQKEFESILDRLNEVLVSMNEYVDFNPIPDNILYIQSLISKIRLLNQAKTTKKLLDRCKLIQLVNEGKTSGEFNAQLCPGECDGCDFQS